MTVIAPIAPPTIFARVREARRAMSSASSSSSSSPVSKLTAGGGALGAGAERRAASSSWTAKRSMMPESRVLMTRSRARTRPAHAPADANRNPKHARQMKTFTLTEWVNWITSTPPWRPQRGRETAPIIPQRRELRALTQAPRAVSSPVADGPSPSRRIRCEAPRRDRPCSSSRRRRACACSRCGRAGSPRRRSLQPSRA